MKSALWLDNGTVIVSPLSMQRIMTAIEKSNDKANGKCPGIRLHVYDVADKDPVPEIDMDVVEVSVDNEEILDDEELLFENVEADA